MLKSLAYKAILHWWNFRSSPSRAGQFFLAVSDYRAGERETIASDLFRLGEGGEIEHGGETYVYGVFSLDGVAYIFPPMSFGYIHRRGDGMRMDAKMIHGLVLQERGLPHTAEPKFEQMPSLFRISLLLLGAIAAMALTPLIFVGSLLLTAGAWLREVLEDWQHSRKQDKARRSYARESYLSDEEAMRIAKGQTYDPNHR